MNLFGFWTLLVALVISGVAAYYSIIGLVAIFAAAAIPIIIMGAALEVGKLTTAVWLHLNWNRAKFFMKAYLSFALVMLMFITSMGIFGFLSKAHIEQTAASTESIVQVKQIGIEIARLNASITRAEQKIEKAEASSGKTNATIQQQIDTEQKRIDDAYKRIQPAIQEQNSIIENARNNDTTKVEPYLVQLKGLDAEIERLDSNAKEYEVALKLVGKDTSEIDAQIKPYTTQIAQINTDIETLQRLSSSGTKAEIKQFQQTIGIKSDGIFGTDTAKATNQWKDKNLKRIDDLSAKITELRSAHNEKLQVERDRLRELIKQARGPALKSVKDRKIQVLKVIDDVRATESPVIKSARDEIARIRASADKQVSESQQLIQKLRDSLKVGNDEDIDNLIEEQLKRIKVATEEIDTLTNEKYALEAETRKLEAEVGPVKYIAEFVYGETADNTMLEEAVRWVILILVLVFDPLAVVLVIAALTIIKVRKEDDPGDGEKKPEPVIEPKLEETQDITVEEVEDNTESIVEPGPEPVVEEEPGPEPVVKTIDPVEPEPIVEPPKKKTKPKTKPVKVEEAELQNDSKGTFYISAEGHKKYIDPMQKELNTKYKIDKTIEAMKAQGRWPNPPESPTDRDSIKDLIRDVLDKDTDGKLGELLENANQSTLEEVYKNIVTDLTDKNS